MLNISNVNHNSIIIESFNGPLFVYGMARSGTSYLRRLINSLPDVYILYESPTIRRAYSIFQKKDILANRSTFQCFLDALKLRERETSMFTQPVEYYDYLYKKFCEHRDFREFCRDLFKDTCNRKGRIWGNKILHKEEMKMLIDVFPHSKFIIIVRDVRAVVSSLHKTTRENYFIASLIWAENARFVRLIKEKLDDHNVLLLRYEDIVSDSRQIIKQIAIFLGLKPPADFSIADIAHTESIEKWRRCLRPKEVRQIEEICFNEMRCFSYEPILAEGPKKMHQLRFIISLLFHIKGRLIEHRRGLRGLFNYKALIRYLRAYHEK